MVVSKAPDSVVAPEVVLRPGRLGYVSMAVKDFAAGMALWRLWLMLGWNDILQRYRRSLLGPFWLTASMAVMVISLGFVYSHLFNTPINDFLPYLCVGLLVWSFLSSFLIEGGVLFTGSESYIKQVRLPFSVYVLRSVWSKTVVFAHNFVIYLGVLVYFEFWPGSNALLVIPGLFLVILNGAMASLLIGMISTRFRDVPQLIASVVQIVFFITPIMWKADLLKDRIYIATLNPFFQLIEVVRGPLLGTIPPVKCYIAVLIITVVNATVTGVFFARFRGRISYWV
jgi:ABC-2 type transport system permease protein/lipopolysaccharide transport system permease protein